MGLAAGGGPPPTRPPAGPWNDPQPARQPEFQSCATSAEIQQDSPLGRGMPPRSRQLLEPSVDSDSDAADAAQMNRRPSDEVSLDIVVALLGGVVVGLLVAAVVGGIGWLSKVQLGAYAGGSGLIAGGFAVLIILTRLTRRPASPDTR